MDICITKVLTYLCTVETFIKSRSREKKSVKPPVFDYEPLKGVGG